MDDLSSHRAGVSHIKGLKVKILTTELPRAAAMHLAHEPMHGAEPQIRMIIHGLTSSKVEWQKGEF